MAVKVCPVSSCSSRAIRAADGETALPHELEAYDGATGALAAWVRVPTLSDAADTELFLYFGAPDTDARRDPAAVWDDGEIVQPLPVAGLMTGDNGEGVADALAFGSSIRRVARRVEGDGYFAVSAGTALADSQVRRRRPQRRRVECARPHPADVPAGNSAGRGITTC